MPTFQQRLQAAVQGGNLTVADLARWFDRPHSTVSFWVRDGKEPGGGPLDAALVAAQLATLERLIKKKKGLPVPRLSPQKRMAHMAAIKKQEMPCRQRP